MEFWSALFAFFMLLVFFLAVDRLGRIQKHARKIAEMLENEAEQRATILQALALIARHVCKSEKTSPPPTVRPAPPTAAPLR